MSLKQILATLGSGQVVNVVNLLQTLVHAVIDEITHVQDELDNQHTSHVDAINRAEDRSGQAIAGTCEQLTTKMAAAVQDLNSRLIALDAKVLSELEACVTTTVDDIGQVQDRLENRINELQETLRTHVERLDTMLMDLSRRVNGHGTLAGYNEPKKE